MALEARNRTRRHALQTLAAAAGAPLLAPAAAAPLPRIAIVGAGMAGMACAWLLDGQAELLLFEAGAGIGGNVQTVPLTLEGHPYRVDIGAQYFHPGPYPTYVALLGQLGLYPPAPGGARSFAASITVADAAEAQPRFVSPVLPGRAWPLLAPWNRAGLQAFNTAFQAAKRRELRDAPWELTLGQWLPTLGLTPAQWQGMLLPWAASLHQGDIQQALELSARSAMVFAALALPDQPTDPILYYTLETGLVEALQRMASQLGGATQVHTATPVTGLQRLADGRWRVSAGAGLQAEVDAVVFAAPAEPVLQLLAGVPGTSAQRAALQAVEWFDARLMLHTDPVYAPADPRWRSFLNCRIEGNACEASMWLGDVLAPPSGVAAPALWKSWVSHRSSLPQQVLAEASYRHLLPTPQTLRAQRALLARQGAGGLWFAGGWTQPFDSQETALRSAMAVADGLGLAGRRRALLPR